MGLIHKPQQSRSQNTQERLLSALASLLEEKFFEQITIRDLALRAEVSSGTIYRRFKDKDALLPVLYQRLNQDMEDWSASCWAQFDSSSATSVTECLRHLVNEHVRFYRHNVAVLRTVYLYMRLRGELSLEDVDAKRRAMYKALLAPVLSALKADGKAAPDSAQIKVFILVLVSSINEYTLFGHLKPVRTLELRDEAFVEELSQVLGRYLGGN
ncbi:MAG: TetR/AcrR family transcriptional regulator [Planctomycetes bacterium]|nr:TetR/AcrR family transcriptional regulator [Planctomycetota bacterium]